MLVSSSFSLSFVHDIIGVIRTTRNRILRPHESDLLLSLQINTPHDLIKGSSVLEIFQKLVGGILLLNLHSRIFLQFILAFLQPHRVFTLVCRDIYSFSKFFDKGVYAEVFM
jgi:hypothetical protein